MMQDPSPVLQWVMGGYKNSNIVIFSDLRTNLQDNYEAAWDLTFASCCTYFDDENFLIQGFINGYSYGFDGHRLTSIDEGGNVILGYGKWQKDW